MYIRVVLIGCQKLKVKKILMGAPHIDSTLCKNNVSEIFSILNNI